MVSSTLAQREPPGPSRRLVATSPSTAPPFQAHLARATADPATFSTRPYFNDLRAPLPEIQSAESRCSK